MSEVCRSDREQCGKFEIHKDGLLHWTVWQSTDQPDWVIAHNIAGFSTRSAARKFAWSLHAAVNNPAQTREEKDLLIDHGLSEFCNPLSKEDADRQAEYGWSYGLAMLAQGLKLSVILRARAEESRVTMEKFEREARQAAEKGN